ncbi:MAG: DUF4349 domain-containing protein [Paludibacter sp.]|nr:DUF4349 domain-containing protein [Paludibacter sp.]
MKNDKAISVADVKSNEEINGKDIADVKEGITQEVTHKIKVEPEKVRPEVINKKIIKDGRLGLQVDNLESAKQKIDSLVKSAGGYYANENLKNSDNQSGYELVIRIPVVNFERFVGSAEKGSSKILYKEIQARDVTEEFVDLESRLNSKRNSLARYNEIMKKANSVKDIIEIEESIRVLQEEIESTQGRLRYLNDCVDFSTLNMTLSTQKDFTFKPVKRDSFWEKLKESMADGWYGLVDFILEFFGLWPYLILIIPLGFFIRRMIKKWKLRKQKQNN